MKSILKYRFQLALSIVIITPLGFTAKLYSGPLAWWVNDFFGGFLYVIFWCLVCAFLLPKISELKICLGVLAITCGLEVLQLWHPSFLEWVRSFFIGRAVIGTTFVWMDFPYYIIGSVAGLTMLRILKKRSDKKPMKRQES